VAVNRGHASLFRCRFLTALPAILIGAYASALVALKLGLGFWGGLVVAAVAGACAAALVGIPSLRVAGDYYIVASFGLQVVILTVFMNWTDLTNGHAGLAGIPRPRVFGLVIDNPFKYVVLSLALAALTYAICRRLTGSAFGRTLRAVREDEIAAQATGKNVVLVKIVITTISSALGALGGSLYAHYITYINPSSFTLDESIFITSFVILGGTERSSVRLGRDVCSRRCRAAEGADQRVSRIDNTIGISMIPSGDGRPSHNGERTGS